MCTATTSPRTIQVSNASPAAEVSRISWDSLHSKFTGLSSTIGELTSDAAIAVNPATPNSSTSAGTDAEVWFI